MLISWAAMHWIMTTLLLLASVVSALHALTHKRDPRSALLWIIVCLSIPLAGPIFYLLFGINRASRTVRQLAAETESPLSTIPPTQVFKDIDDRYLQQIRLVTMLTGSPLTEGNRVEVLSNGEEAYPAMLAAIDQAQSWIYFCTYIFEHKETGAQFIDALRRAVKRGVEVYVLLDGVGAWYSWGRTAKVLRRHGVRVIRFLPPGSVIPKLTINLRNHRKILLIDGQSGFTGGMNIRQTHLIDQCTSSAATRDLMFRLQGPVLCQIIRVYEDDWLYACGEHLPDGECDLSFAGTSWCRAISDGPGVHLDILAKILISAINGARTSISIMTPYFLPPRELIVALQSAALRGVEVTLILPQDNNLPYIHWAMRNCLWQFLQFGVRIYYQPPPFNHSKLFIVDEYYCQIGSANLDSRSLRLNFELNVEIYDQALGRLLSDRIEAIRIHSRETSLNEMQRRSYSVKIWDAFWWLFTPYL